MLFHLHSLVSEDPANEKTRFVVNDENREVLKDLKFYLAKQPGKLDYRKGILFHGKVGNGKTLVLEMMKRCISDMWGKNLIIFTAPFIKLQLYNKDREPQMSYETSIYKFLGINDIGLETMTGSGDEIIRNIIYERFEGRLHTFGTTNLDMKQFSERYEYPDGVGRMTDRFKHLFNYVSLTGKSFR